MKGKMNDRDAKCPFFCAHTKDSVYCESLIPDSRIKLNFDTISKKNLHYNLFCCYKYENCELHQAVMKIYEEADE